jgi:hypothetical protein
VQLSGSVSIVPADWITSSGISTNWGPPFLSSSTAIVSVPTALFVFQEFQRAFNFYSA